MPAETDLLHAAKAWHDAGYCVIPSHEDGGKRPFGAWKQYQSQRPEWEQVRIWLASGRYSGIGVLTGDGFEMVEIEGPLEAAVERLGRVIEAARQADMLDLVQRVATGCVEQSAGGGLHLFIRVIDGPAKGNTKLAHAADGKVIAETRGAGGFVIVAPTPGRNGHPEGASYMFLQGSSPAGTPEVTGRERDELHDLLALALDESADDPEPEPVAERPAPRPGDGLSAFDDYRQRVTWRDILEPAGWTWSHRDGERDYWVRPGKAKAEGHSASTIEDGPLVNFSTSVDWPVEKGLTKGYVHALIHHGGDLSAAAKALAAAGYGTPGTSGTIPAWEAELDPDATEEERQEAAKSWVEENLPRLDWHELWRTEHREEWIVRPLLAARRLVALYSAPKVGKSLLMLEIAAAVANGRGMFGYPPPERAYRTLYVDFENDPQADIRERLEAMKYGPDDLDNLVLLSFPTIAKLDTEKGATELMAAVEHYGVEIVVIDTVSRAVAGEENENDTWLNFYKFTGMKLKRAGVALIRLDHAGKDEARGQRGGSAKSGDVDAVWRMSKDGDDRIDLTCEAQRFPISETRLALERVEDDQGLRHVVIGNPAREREDRLLQALIDLNVDKTLTRTDAGAALRAAGEKFKGRLPEDVWARYRDIPRPFTVVQDSL